MTGGLDLPEEMVTTTTTTMGSCGSQFITSSAKTADYGEEVRGSPRKMRAIMKIKLPNNGVVADRRAGAWVTPKWWKLSLMMGSAMSAFVVMLIMLVRGIKLLPCDAAASSVCHYCGPNNAGPKCG